MAAESDEDPGPISFSIPGRWPVYSRWVWTMGEGVVYSVSIAWPLTAYQGLNGGQRRAAVLFSWSSLSSGKFEDRRNPTSRALSVKLSALCFIHPLTRDHKIRCLGSKEWGWDLGLGSGSERETWPGRNHVCTVEWKQHNLYIYIYKYICEMCTCYQIVYIITILKLSKISKIL